MFLKWLISMIDDVNTRYVAYIDGCRGIAIALVLFSHVGLGNIIPGGFGVTIFFFISGFLITKLLISEMANSGQISLKKFYLRRFFRLYPALLAMIILAWITVQFLGCYLPIQNVLAALFYFTNYYISWFREPVSDCARILDIFWSLSIEEHFYLFFPLLTSMFLQKKQKIYSTRFVYFLLFLCAFSLSSRILLFVSHPDDLSYASGRIYFSTHTRMDSILWGCIAALLLFELKSAQYIKMLTNKRFLFLGLLLILLSLTIRNSGFRETWRYTMQGIGLMLLLPSLTFIRNRFTISLFENPALIFIGKISYSLYLFHFVSIKIANAFAPEFSFKWAAIFWPISIIFALSSYFFVEKPFVTLRRKFGSHS